MKLEVLWVLAAMVAACSGTRDQRAEDPPEAGAGGAGVAGVARPSAGFSGSSDPTETDEPMQRSGAGGQDKAPSSPQAGQSPVDDAPGGAEADGGAGGGTTAGGCATADDCELPVTVPENCAEAVCDGGQCSYVGVDADGDGFRVDGCTSRTPGVSIETGDDCNDADSGVSPNGWDGPEGEGFPNGCNDDVDQDCNGLFDDGQLPTGETCVCNPGESGACATSESGVVVPYPVLEQGQPLGACRFGARECLPNGTWGACTGAVGPKTETCDGSDNDCDGVPSVEDPDVILEHTFVCDADQDNHVLVDGAALVVACLAPLTGCEAGQWLTDPGLGEFDDCDDTDPQKNPEETEQCNGKDDDCDGDIDEAGAVGEEYWSYDADGDSYRDQSLPTYYQCDPPDVAPEGCAGSCPADAWVNRAAAPLLTHDCDDADPQRNPGATDLCNGVDQDCDGSTVTGCPCTSGETQACGTHPEDGIGICTAGEQTCSGAAWGSCVGSVGREAEVCGDEDRDCDGTPGSVDPDATDRTTWVCDQDQDGRLSESAAVETLACTMPAASSCNAGNGDWVSNPGTSRYDDCDDSDPDVSPLQTEVCDGKDNDCDALTDAADSLAGSPQNAGVTYACEGGQWVITQCPANTLHCDTDVNNGCETDATSLGDCRACGNTCLFACGTSDCVEVAALTGGSQHTCALGTDGRASCWGNNGSGRLGDGSTTERHVPMTVVNITDVRAISAGGSHTCAVVGSTLSGYCWGAGTSGQLGSGSATSSPQPVSAQLTGITSLSAGSAHTCAVHGSGSVKCWGDRADGRIGDFDSAGTQVSPTAVYDCDLTELETGSVVAAGRAHSCLLDAAGGVWCWGDDSLGQLGDGTTLADQNCAVEVTLPATATAIATQNNHTCVLLDNGTGTCWGSNDRRQIADTADAYYAVPTPVGNLSGASAVTVGSNYVCTLASGAVQCWGGNTYGQRGDTAATASYTPTLLALSNVTRFAAGGSHVCAQARRSATDLAGQVSCWGYNSNGQLGNDATSGENMNATPAELEPLGG